MLGQWPGIVLLAVTTAPSKTEIVKPKVTHPKPAAVGAKPDVIGPKPAVIGAKPSYGAKPPLTDKTHLGGPRSVVNKAKLPQRLEQAGSAKIQKKCIGELLLLMTDFIPDKSSFQK